MNHNPDDEFSASYCGQRRRLSFFFKWFDFWVGLYWDRKARVLYICPLPMIGIRIAFEHPATARRLIKRIEQWRRDNQ
jgi:hypothetical protein